MIRAMLTGFWICVVTLASCYGGVYWGGGAIKAKSEEYLPGLEYQKVRPITVPIVREGGVQGYILLTLVFTGDARTLHTISLSPESFIMDEAFRTIYADERLDFRKLERYDVYGLLSSVRANVNRRLGADIVSDLLVENFNFVSKADMRNNG